MAAARKCLTCAFLCVACWVGMRMAMRGNFDVYEYAQHKAT